MNFTLLELNELIYCVGTATKTGTMVNKNVAIKLWAQLSDELERRCNLLDMAENGPAVEMQPVAGQVTRYPELPTWALMLK
jgi:hypothetical protein